MFALPSLLLAAPLAASQAPQETGSSATDPAETIPAEDLPPTKDAWSWGPDFAPEFNVYGNLIARKERKPIYDEDGNEVSDIARMRQIDFILDTPIGPRVDAFIATSIRSNPANTEYSVEFDQAFVSFGMLPVLGDLPTDMTFMIGRQRAKFGRLNRERIYDLPQLNRPRSLTQFFGEDGYSQSTASMAYSVPTENFGVFHFDAEYMDSGSPPLTIDDGGAIGGNNLRASWLSSPGAIHGFEVGASQLNARRVDQSGERSRVTGVDALYSWRPQPDARPAFWLGGEWLSGRVDLPMMGSRQEPGGFYAWTLVRLDDTWYVGARYDLSEELDNDSLQTATESLYVTYMVNEHARIQLAVERSQSDVEANDDVTRVLVELNFSAGTNPHTPFWLR